MKNNTTKNHHYVVFITSIRRFHKLSSNNKYSLGELVSVRYKRLKYHSTVCHLI